MNKQLKEIIELLGEYPIEILQITKGLENQWFLEFIGNEELWYPTLEKNKHLSIESKVRPSEYKHCPFFTKDNSMFICIEFKN